MRREERTEPAHHQRRAASAVREQNQWELRRRGCERSVRGRLAQAEERKLWRADPLRLLHRVSIGWIPDRGDESVSLRVAPVVGLAYSECPGGYTDFVRCLSGWKKKDCHEGGS